MSAGVASAARRLIRWYGASPQHLLALVGGSAVSAYAVSRVSSLQLLAAIGLWFVGTLLVHDLVLFPAYAAADNLGALARGRRGRPAVPWVNHVRVPLVWSGVLLLAWFPLVLRVPSGYQRASARTGEQFLGSWLAVTAALFLASALVYVVRAARVHRADRAHRAGRSGSADRGRRDGHREGPAPDQDRDGRPSRGG